MQHIFHRKRHLTHPAVGGPCFRGSWYSAGGRAVELTSERLQGGGAWWCQRSQTLASSGTGDVVRCCANGSGRQGRGHECTWGRETKHRFRRMMLRENVHVHYIHSLPFPHRVCNIKRRWHHIHHHMHTDYFQSPDGDFGEASCSSQSPAKSSVKLSWTECKIH